MFKYWRSCLPLPLLVTATLFREVVVAVRVSSHCWEISEDVEILQFTSRVTTHSHFHACTLRCLSWWWVTPCQLQIFYFSFPGRDSNPNSRRVEIKSSSSRHGREKLTGVIQDVPVITSLESGQSSSVFPCIRPRYFCFRDDERGDAYASYVSPSAFLELRPPIYSFSSNVSKHMGF